MGIYVNIDSLPTILYGQKELSCVHGSWRNRMSYVRNGPSWARDHDQGGGAVLPISPYRQKFVMASWSDPSNHCLWINLLVQERLLGFFSIYAPNSKSEHTQLCTWLESSQVLMQIGFLEVILTWLSRMVIGKADLVI